MAETMDDRIGTMASLIRESELKTNDVGELREKASRGDSGAVLRMANICREKRNYSEALKYYAILAEHGNTEAMYQAGMAAMSARYNQAKKKSERLYYQQEGLRFLAMAAENGKLDAEFQLGMIYASSSFISQKLFARKENDRRSVEHLLRAASKSHPQAQYYLSRAYADGIGVRRSIDEEFFWLRCAQINGDKKAAEYLNKYSRTDAANALKSMLVQIDKKIAAHPEYIKVYHTRKEMRR